MTLQQHARVNDMAGSVSSVLHFYVNGQKIIDASVDPEWSLLTYLRSKLRLCGTKRGCGEGGCGSCTVMVSKYNRKDKKIDHYSVNACLAPLVSVHGLAITTVEGIGSTKTKLHAVQERLANFHGSQCGFCTPGIVMSMYTLLRNNPFPTSEDLDTYLQGNLCRCTGYRPIIQGFRTFTVAGPEGDGIESYTSNGCCKQTNGHTRVVGKCGDTASNCCATIGDCCQASDGNCCIFDDQSEYIPLYSTFQPCPTGTEPIFPSELQLSSRLDDESLHFHGKYMRWYRPTSLEELLTLKRRHPDAKVVVGNTELGIEKRSKNCQFPVMIQVTHIKQLTNINERQYCVKLGASLTLRELEAVCMRQSRLYPAWKVQVFTELVNILHYFGGKQIRNVASIGGNLMTASPISDLNPIWVAAGCYVEVFGNDGTRIIKMDDNFFTGYRKTAIKPEEVLISIHVPYLEENEYFAAFKQSRRREDDIAIVNSAFRLRLRNQKVEDIRMCFGGMSSTAVLAVNTMDFMCGKTWSKDMIEEALSRLSDELSLDPSAPGGMIRFRQSLVLSFFYKFYLRVSVTLNSELCPIAKGSLSATKPISRNKRKGMQVYAPDREREASLRVVGKPYMHGSAIIHATGEAVYCDDMPRFENELYLGLVLSQKAHAKIVEIDAVEALKLDGVHDFVCHKDLPKCRNSFGVTKSYVDEEVFASEEVYCVGQIIGAVIARDQACARNAAKIVRVEYEDLPAIITIDDAIARQSFLTPEKSIRRGNPEGAFVNCAHMIKGESRSGAQEHFYLETQATIAVPKGEHGEMELISSTQNPTGTQRIVAHVLGVAENRVVCKVKRIGGGFGGKETRSIPISTVVAVAAQKMNKPVRIVLDRDEDILITGWRHSFFTKYKVGFDNTGRLHALCYNMYSNAGCTMDLSFAVMNKALLDASIPYSIPNISVKGVVCKTNLPSCTAFRGFGSPQSTFVNENVLNDIATFLGEDPAKIRELNLFRPGDMTHYGHLIGDNCVRRCWDECLKQSCYFEARHEISKFNGKNLWKKRGISINPTMFGIAFFEAKFMNQAGALVNVYTDGSVLLSHGGTEMGQGLHTKMTQIASEVLGIDLSFIHISEASTDKVPNTMPTAGSTSTDLNGMAVYNACVEINKRLEPYRKDRKTWEEVVLAAYHDQISLSATGYFSRPDIGYDIDSNTGKAFSYFTNGAACSVVEIDCLTGDHRVLRTDIVMDVGKSINPAIDIGQIEGAFIQGYGLFVLEQMVHSPDGVPLTRGPGAYKIPGFDDIPAEFNVTLLKDSPNVHSIYSSKGIGEPALGLASSVFFAIKDAIASVRKDRALSPLFQLIAPATAERIRMACEDEFTRRVPLVKERACKPWGIQI